MVIVVLWNFVQSLRSLDVPTVGEDLDRWGRVLSEEEKEYRRAAFAVPPDSRDAAVAHTVARWIAIRA